MVLPWVFFQANRHCEEGLKWRSSTLPHCTGHTLEGEKGEGGPGSRAPRSSICRGLDAAARGDDKKVHIRGKEFDSRPINTRCRRRAAAASEQGGGMRHSHSKQRAGGQQRDSLSFQTLRQPPGHFAPAAGAYGVGIQRWSFVVNRDARHFESSYCISMGTRRRSRRLSGRDLRQGGSGPCRHARSTYLPTTSKSAALCLGRK